MRSTYCIACSTEYPVRKEDGPFRMLSCVRCIASRGYALFCDVCRYRWHSQKEEAICPRCVANKLGEEGIFVEFKGARV